MAMPRRKAWNGNTPDSAAAARRYLLDVARECVERLGVAKAGLSDVAEAAGVTRQTVYRYFDNAEDLFRSAAVLASGGFHEQLRKKAMRRSTLAERIVECVVQCVIQIPNDPHLRAITQSADQFSVSSILHLGFVQEEIAVLEVDGASLSRRDRDELAELMLRVLNSFLADPGPQRSERELRAFLSRWITPMVEAQLTTTT